jgi:hypothetical protein
MVHSNNIFLAFFFYTIQFIVEIYRDIVYCNVYISLYIYIVYLYICCIYSISLYMLWVFLVHIGEHTDPSGAIQPEEKQGKQSLNPHCVNH